MAMMDNVDFLIAHVRHSFLTSDDSGMAEAVIEVESTTNNNNNPGAKNRLMRYM
jgi:hypothetical protein